MAYITGSPSVTIKEQDLATFVNPASVTIGATVGSFIWGPCNTPTILTNEDDLLRYFGQPTDQNYKDWFTARNFLAYSNDLRLVRIVAETSVNACDVAAEATQIGSMYDFTAMLGTLSGSGKTAKIFARYPGDYGNRIRVVISDATALEEEENVLASYVNQLTDKDSVAVGVFVDDAIVEFGVYSFNKSAKNFNGESNYVISAVNDKSSYIYLVESKLITETSPGTRDSIDIDVTLSGGVLDAPVAGDYINGWNIFRDADLYDVSLLMQAGGDGTVGKHILENVAANRKDAIACVSPQESEVVNVPENGAITAICTASTTMGYSSYRFMDGNYKYQYDSYNNVYRWVPLNGDIAGIFAEVDTESAPWFSPGNHTIKDCIKLAISPSKADRDELYKYRVNPVTSFTNTGFVLYGDWTGADTTTSFNFVNVRRLFLHIEKSIAQYARQIMWKQNDEITQTQFFQAVDPFLRDIQGGRGIQDYRVICDGTVNNAEVVNAGMFVAKIYVKPIYSIRWVEITFVSTRSDVSFEEIAQS